VPVEAREREARRRAGSHRVAVVHQAPGQQREQRGDDPDRGHPGGELEGHAHQAGTMKTVVPTSTCSNSHSASEMCIRTQPCEREYPIEASSGVPWIPTPGAESPIQRVPSGFPGPGGTGFSPWAHDEAGGYHHGLRHLTTIAKRPSGVGYDDCPTAIPNARFEAHACVQKELLRLPADHDHRSKGRAADLPRDRDEREHERRPPARRERADDLDLGRVLVELWPTAALRQVRRQVPQQEHRVDRGPVEVLRERREIRAERLRVHDDRQRYRRPRACVHPTRDGGLHVRDRAEADGVGGKAVDTDAEHERLVEGLPNRGHRGLRLEPSRSGRRRP